MIRMIMILINSDGNLSFKNSAVVCYSLGLSILKKSLVESGDYLLERDEDELNDDDNDRQVTSTQPQDSTTHQTVQDQPKDDYNSYAPSIYARGTSLRSRECSDR